jgi:hypothetical protein
MRLNVVRSANAASLYVIESTYVAVHLSQYSGQKKAKEAARKAGKYSQNQRRVTSPISRGQPPSEARLGP